jgi:MFS family permease
MTVGGAVVVLMLLRSARGVVIPLWGEHIGLSVSRIGFVFSASAAVDLLMFIPAGFVMDMAGRRTAGALCIGIFALGLLVMPLQASFGWFLVSAILVGLGNGFGAGINMTLGSDLAPDDAVGEFLGLWRLFGDIGATAGPPLVGAVAALVSLPLALLSIALIGFGGAALMLFAAPETMRLRD